MTRKNGKTMSTLSHERVDISTGEIFNMSTPAETRINTGSSEESGQLAAETNVHPASVTGVDTIPENVGAKKAAELLGIEQRSVNRQCESGKYEGAKKHLVNGVEVWRIPVPSLPIHARRKLAEEIQATRLERLANAGLTIAAPEDNGLGQFEYRAMWEAYGRSGETNKRRAEAALNALWTFNTLVDSGSSIGDAEKAIAASHGVSKPTLWRYRQTVKGHPKCNWLPLLSPRYKGGRPPAEFTEAAYQYILGKQKNTSRTKLTVILREARTVAASRGWVIPSYDAVAARLAREPKWLDIVGREGKDALEHSYPAAKKDYSTLGLHQLWESDGRKADVFCIWPDGCIARPFIIVWREVRSRLVLGVRGFLNPSAQGVIAAFGQALERAGTAPDEARIDNGPEYAAKSVTGGQTSRYRFSITPGEQPGIMTLVGTRASWAPPGRGQDKPIESWWNFVADNCDKLPDFEGAYVGSGPQKKPENFAMKNAIPIAIYEEKLCAVINYFNTMHRHSGSGMNMRTPLDVYTELTGLKKRPPVDPSHLRMCRMGRAEIKPDKKDSSYSLTIPGYGVHRYWSRVIAEMTQDVLSRKHAVYYDLENPKSPVLICDGYAELGEAYPIEAIPFLDAGGTAAVEHVKAKNAYLKPKKAALKAIKQAARQEVGVLPAASGLVEIPQPLHVVTVQGRKTPAVEAPPQPHVFTEEEEKTLAESRQRAERNKTLNKWRYANTGHSR